MTRSAALAVVLCGCNAVFGLDEPSGRNPDASPDTAGPTEAGSVAAMSYDYAGAPITFTVTAAFGPSSNNCFELMRIGGCVTAMCDNGVPAPHPDAGQIVFAGGQEIELDPDVDGNYAPFNGLGVLFVAGEPLRVAAAGGDVEAFAKTLATPVPVVFPMGSGLPAAGQPPVNISRTADLALQWTGGTVSGHVGVGISSQTSQMVIQCLFQAGPGAGLIDRMLLSELPAGGGGLSTTVTIYDQVRSGPYAISASASVVGKHPDGSWASGAMSLF